MKKAFIVVFPLVVVSLFGYGYYSSGNFFGSPAGEYYFEAKKIEKDDKLSILEKIELLSLSDATAKSANTQIPPELFDLRNEFYEKTLFLRAEQYLNAGDHMTAFEFLSKVKQSVFAEKGKENLRQKFQYLEDKTYEAEKASIWEIGERVRELCQRGRHDEAEPLLDLADARIQLWYDYLPDKKEWIERGLTPQLKEAEEKCWPSSTD